MATNPKLPDYPNIPPRKPVDDHTKVRMIRQSKFPWSIVAIIIGAALIIAVIGFFPKGPRKVTAPSGAQIPPQPTAAQVEFTGVQIDPSTVGNALYLKGVASQRRRYSDYGCPGECTVYRREWCRCRKRTGQSAGGVRRDLGGGPDASTG